MRHSGARGLLKRVIGLAILLLNQFVKNVIHVVHVIVYR